MFLTSMQCKEEVVISLKKVKTPFKLVKLLVYTILLKLNSNKGAVKVFSVSIKYIVISNGLGFIIIIINFSKLFKLYSCFLVYYFYKRSF